MRTTGLWKGIYKRAQRHTATFIVYLILRLFLYGLFVLSLFRRDYTAVFYCTLCYGLCLLPFWIEKTCSVLLPPALEITLLLFIFCAEILGELSAFYVVVPWWDGALHTLNGFLSTAIGFSLIYLLNRRRRVGELSPVYLAVAAFCFSMTVGVVWEFFEFFADTVLHADMQKDTLITVLRSVALDPTRTNTVVRISGIARTVLYDADGNALATIEGGFLDVGIFDTMKDLILNFAGSLVFTVLAFLADGKKWGEKFFALLVPKIDGS